MREAYANYGANELPAIIFWLNSLAGSQWTSGKVIRVIDWQIITAKDYAYQAVVRVEVQARVSDESV